MRTKTPPELKWLLVERATIAGNVDRLRKLYQSIGEELRQAEITLRSLDQATNLLYERVNAQAAGVVHQHSTEYGKRGALKAYMVSILKNTPSGFTARMIARMVCGHFQLCHPNHRELQRFIENTLRPQLNKLRREGLVENISSPGPEGMLWRWKTQLPTLSALREWANEGSAGDEMAHQRDSHA